MPGLACCQPVRQPSFVILGKDEMSPLPFFECFTGERLAAAYTNLRGFEMAAASADPETLAVPAALPVPS